MRESPLAKGLIEFDPESALQQLYDYVTKSSAQEDQDYEFIHEMMNKSTDGMPLSLAEVEGIHQSYRKRFGGV